MEVEVVYFIFCVVIFIGVVTDVKMHKIPNKVIVCGIILGILYRFVRDDVVEMRACYSLLIPFGLLFPIFCLGMIGAGDIKFLCMMAVVMEPVQALYLVFYSCIFGAVWAGGKMVKNKSLKRRFGYLKAYMKNLLITEQAKKYFVKDQGYSDTIPFALPIALSFVLYMGGMY